MGGWWLTAISLMLLSVSITRRRSKRRDKQGQKRRETEQKSSLLQKCFPPSTTNYGDIRGFEWQRGKKMERKLVGDSRGGGAGCRADYKECCFRCSLSLRFVIWHHPSYSALLVERDCWVLQPERWGEHIRTHPHTDRHTHLQMHR